MMLVLSLLSTMVLQDQPSPAQDELRIFAAPFGPALVKAHPDVRIFFQSQRTSSHVSRLGVIESRAMGVTCDTAFTTALGQIVGSAVMAGGNGVVDLRSPEAPEMRAPTFACLRLEDGVFVVRLTALAARLNGSDAPVIAAKPLQPGMSIPAAGFRGRTMEPAPGLPLPPIYPVGSSRRFNLSRYNINSDGMRFVGHGAGETVVRRINDVDAVGASMGSCPDALQDALAGLYREARRFEGAAGVVGIRSPGLPVVDGGYAYICEQAEISVVVRLTGVAAGAALQAVEQGR